MPASTSARTASDQNFSLNSFGCLTNVGGSCQCFPIAFQMLSVFPSPNNSHSLLNASSGHFFRRLGVALRWSSQSVTSFALSVLRLSTTERRPPSWLIGGTDLLRSSKVRPRILFLFS